jgi:hypothetical protein
VVSSRRFVDAVARFGIASLLLGGQALPGRTRTFAFDEGFLEAARSTPPPLPTPIARQAAALHRPCEPPGGSRAELVHALQQTRGRATIPARRLAVVDDALLFDAACTTLVQRTATAMGATSPCAPDSWLYLRLTTHEHATESSAMLECRVDAYLLDAAGEVRHAVRSMTERRDFGGATEPPPAPPAGMVRVQGEGLFELFAREALPRPYGYLTVLTRSAIHDLGGTVQPSG